MNASRPRVLERGASPSLVEVVWAPTRGATTAAAVIVLHRPEAD